MSASVITRILPRAWRARDASESPGREARRSSSRASRVIAIALFPCATASSAKSRSEPRPSLVAMWRSWMISVPTADPARSCERCNGSAASGNTASRPYMRPSQSSAVHEMRSFARRRRSRKVSASSRRVRNAGDSGGNKRNESAATPLPAAIASAKF